MVQLNDAGKENVLVIGATNRPQMIDLAVLRSGRMDKRIYVNPPDFEARKEILKLTLSNKPIDEDIEFDILANLLDGYSSSDLELIVNQTARNCIKLDKNFITQEMIIESIKNTKSSLKTEEIEYYDQFSHIERF